MSSSRIREVRRSFVCMQKALTLMVGMRYRDLPKLMKEQLQRMRERKTQ